MPILHFEGSSDDTFGEVNVTKDDFDDCAAGSPIDWLITAPGVDGGLIVTGQHGRAITGKSAVFWQIGVAAYDPNFDDQPIPDWPISFTRSDRGYSPRLVVVVPDGFSLTCLRRDAVE